MSKKKFDNVVLTPQTNNSFESQLVNELSSVFAVDFSKSKEVLLSNSLAIYFSLTVVSIALVILVNVLFFPLLVFGVVKVFDSYKFYLIKKDFEENGIF